MGREREMDDEQIYGQINRLAAEEETLWGRASDGSGLSGDEKSRLKEIQIQLDQAYDLLRQRSARRAAGMDPNEAEVRPEQVVENYEQ